MLTLMDGGPEELVEDGGWSASMEELCWSTIIMSYSASSTPAAPPLRSGGGNEVNRGKGGGSVGSMGRGI